VTQLNQIIAIEKGTRAKAERTLTSIYHTIQKPPLFTGIARTYQPKNDDGDRLPPESTAVQVKVDEALKTAADELVRMFDVTLTKETENTDAFADVKVGDIVIMEHVPVTYLLFLEKQLGQLHTLITKLPILDPAETWAYDPATGAYATPVTETTRTKKVPRNWVKAEATERHPAQVEVYHEDVIVGTWATRKFSGAIPADRAKQLLDRVDALMRAVTFAREEANSKPITDRRESHAIFDYLLAP
jgi:hypothetical protein